MDWWVGCQDWDSMPDLRGPSEAYEAHFAEIAGDLPSSIVDFTKAISLHDGSLINVTVDVPRQMLMLAVELDTGRTAALLYLGLISYEVDNQEPRCLPGPAKYGDIGYTEFDRADGGGFTHSWLFSSGIQMTIVAMDFAWDAFDFG